MAKPNNKYERVIDYSWDYKGEDTKTFTHGLHSYPAMFIPQVARRLIETYSKKGDTLCDIFCGSGTALVESRLSGRNAYGIDLNPLAIFLAKAKTMEINPSILHKEYFRLLDRVRQINTSKVRKPMFKNIDFWFKEDVITQLARIKMAIKEIENKKVSDFFMVAFSETVRQVSNTKSGEFKLVRRKNLDKHNPNVLDIFKKNVEPNIVGMSDFYNSVNKKIWAKPILGDSSSSNGIRPNSIDCIVTSPPYGDSRTTVAYGQFSRLSSQWIDLFNEPDEASQVDNNLLGGRPVKQLINNLNSPHLKIALNEIAGKDERRAKDVLSFYLGLNECLKQAYSILKPKGYLCIVIGNRLVKQVRIPTDFIIADLSQNIGFKLENIIVRNIPGKTMPLRNSPTNVTGALEDTMTRESIVILRKIK